MNFANINASMKAGVNAPTADQSRRTKAVDSARKFEELFARQMVNQMQKSSITDEEGGLFGKGIGSSTYSSWFTDHLASKLTEGRGLGVAESVMRYMEKGPGVPSHAEAYPDENKNDGGMIDAFA